MKGKVHLTLSQTLKGGAALFVALLALLACAWLQPTFAYAAEETSQPDVSKTLTANGDGTYNLTLSVAGRASSSQESSNANVVIIFDTSGSMSEAAYVTRYLPVTDNNRQNRYGLADGAYVPLTYSYWTNAYYVTDTGERYDGQRYRQVITQQGTRMSNAKTATNALIESLLDNNTTADLDAVEIALVDFSTTVNSVASWTTNESALTTQVNGYRANGGTNWEAALSRAKSLADTKAKAQPDEATYIVFVSDGNPTFRNSRLGGNDWNDYYGVYGTGNSDPSGYNFDAAKAVADGILGAGYNLYTVNAFGDAVNMQNLGGTYQSAEDPDALTAAFNEIVNKITNAAAFTNVKVTDTLTELTATGLNADPASFTYTKGGVAWAEAPAAAYADGTVTWDLSSAGQLEHNVTYAVSFRVWPSQEALDIAAELVGGLKSYDGLTADQKAQIVAAGTDAWALNTNVATGNQVAYTQQFTKTSKNQPADDDPATEGIQNDGYTFTQAADGTWVGQKGVEGAVAFTNPDPVALTHAQMPVEKLWKNDIDNRAATEATLGITRDGAGYTSVTLNSANAYKAHATVSVGLIAVAANGSYKVLEPGHDYAATEPANFDGGAWQFQTQTAHPMLVNGQFTMLFKATKETGTYKIGDSWYSVGAAGASLASENVRRSSLSLAKLVDDLTGGAAPADAEFSYAIGFKSPDGSNVVFTVLDGTGQPAAATTSAKDNGDGTYTAESGAPFTLNLKTNWTVVFQNLATGTDFSIVETAMPEGFSFKVIEANNGEPANATDIERGLQGTIGAADTAYAIANVNTFDSVTLSGGTALKVTKQVTGRAATEAFNFELAAGDDATAAAVQAGSVVMGATTATTADDMGDGATQTLNFGGITFYKEGAYTFKVHEANAAAPAGWTYDTAEKMITVTVAKDNSGKLQATVEGNNPTVTNAYAASSTKAQIEVRKDLVSPDGDTAPDITGKFTFTLQAVDGAPMPADADAQGIASVTSPAAGQSTKFGEIEYAKAGTYTYLMNETGHVDGVTNDPNANKRITVDVTDNGDGTLSAVVNGGETIVFTNAYDEAAIVLPVTKVLEVPEGFTGPGDIKGKYTFTLEANDGAPMPEGATGTTMEKTNPAANGGTELFGPIVFKEAGTYTYTVTETGHVDGVTNDAAAVKTVTVTVVKDDAGQLAATWEVANGTNAATDPNQAVRFTNTYNNITPAKVTIPIAKTVNAADDAYVPAWEYTFTLANSDGVPVDVQTIAGDANARTGQGAFKELSFSAPGTYTYTVTESGAVDGITTDPVPVAVTVEVVDNGNGTLSVTTNANQGATVAFWNTYETTQLDVVKQWEGDGELTELRPAYVNFELWADGQPTGKVIALTSQTAWAGSFFNLPVYSDSAKQHKIAYTIKEDPVEGYTGSYDAAVDVGKITNTIDTGSLEVSKTVNAADGLTAPDAAFTFTIALDKKIEGVFSGVTFVDGVATIDLRDGESKTIAGLPAGAGYTVTEGAVAGFTAEATGNTGTIGKDATATAAFTNTYAVTPATAQIYAAKSLVVPPELAGPAADNVKGAFTFKLTAVDGAPLPEGGTTVTNTDGAATPVAFGEISYTKPGTYRYKVTESGSLPGVTNDPIAEKFVKVTVADNGDGTLTAVSSAPKGNPVVFANTYSSSGAFAEALIEKTVEAQGDAWAGDSGKTFAFAIEAGSNDAGVATPVPENATASLTFKEAGTKTIGFGAIKFTAAGTYHYTVRETTAPGDGWTCDNEPHEVTVKVTDKGDGTLEAAVEGGVAKIANTYKTTSATATIAVAKNLTVPEGLTGPTADAVKGAFTFTLAAVDGAPLPVDGTTVANPDGKGTAATFGEIEFTEPGTYTYTVTESGALAGVTNDAQSSKTVTVTVTDNGAGALVAESSATASDPVVFTNAYNAAPAETTGIISVQKQLTGRDWMSGDAFTFALAAENGAPLPAATTVTATSADAVSFGAITYAKPGAYHYTVTEQAGSIPGVSYSAHAQHVTVLVTDNAAGKLEAKAVYGTDAQAAVFENTYTPEATTATFSFTKVLKNADIKDGVFNFELAAKDGAPLPASTNAVNDAQGTVTFGSITYTQPGTYAYTVKETVDASLPYAYDTTEKTVTVTVTDNPATGKLEAAVSYPAGTTFTNTYKAASGETVIEAAKLVNGQAPEASGLFSFTITAQDGGALPAQTTVKNVGGTVAFGPIVYDESIFAGAAAEAVPAEEAAATDEAAASATATGEAATSGTDAKATGTDGAASPKKTAADTNAGTKPAATESASSSAGKADSAESADGKADAAGEVSAAADAATDATASSSSSAAAAKTSLVAETADAAETDAAGAPTAPVQVGPDGKRFVEYHYTIVEAKGNAAGYTYDPEAKVVTVRVVDNGDGTLTATQTGTAPVFNNTYAAEGALEITATKVVEGPAQLVADQFEFGLFEGDSQVATALNDATGKVTFNVSYDLAAVGDHVYTIREIGPDATGYTMDDSVKTVHVTVTDAGEGALEATVTEGAGATFTNVYKPYPTAATIAAKKVLEGADLTEGAFAFQLAGEDGTVMQTAANAADGTVAFQVPLTEAGTFTYTVTEVNDGQTGVTYSDAALVYTATVTDAGGKLEATVAAPDEAIFTNVYTVPPAEEEPPADQPPAPADPGDTPVTPTAGTSAPTPASGGTAATTPTTGDATLPLAAGAAALALAGAVLAAIARKKGKNGNE